VAPDRLGDYPLTASWRNLEVLTPLRRRRADDD